MNERIKELAKQAHAFVNRHSRENITVNVGDIFEKKFAELIVRECANFVYYKAEKSMSQEIVYVGDDLLKHFGVE